jgi:hypothetical protein
VRISRWLSHWFNFSPGRLYFEFGTEDHFLLSVQCVELKWCLRSKAFDNDGPRLDERFLASPAATALVGEGNGCATRVTVQDEWAD